MSQVQCEYANSKSRKPIFGSKKILNFQSKSLQNESVPDSYAPDQDRMNSEYRQAWKDAPPEWRKKAFEAGIKGPEIDQDSMAMEFHETFMTASYTPSMSDMIDTRTDEFIEKYGSEYSQVIQGVMQEMGKTIMAEAERERSLLLARVVCFVVKSESINMLASIHQLMHAIPRLAQANGYKSLRASARACNVSVEWIRKGRNRWCELLELPIPEEGKKTENAKKACKISANTNHWRRQKFIAEKINTKIKTQ